MGLRNDRIWLSLLTWSCCALVGSAAEPAGPDFQDEVVPLLKNRCVRCHGPAKLEAKLNLSLPPGIARGGESGAAVVPGKPADSLLWQLVESDEMPKDEPLPDDEKKLLWRWIESGAHGLPERVSAVPDGDEHWAFQKLQPTPPPAVRDGSRIRTPVDVFVQARLEQAGLTLGAPAAAQALIRRVSFDLTGLPPTAEEIETFLNDRGEQAYESMVERYLASPRYGERWGKYWLDAAGYADSNGYFGADTDRPLAWRYRDYVIRSINADKPLDQFIREQLAGDELAHYGPDVQLNPEMIELLTATHFLRNSPDGTDSSDGNPDELRADKYAVLEGTLQIIGSSLFGLTVQCARCHDHKFEPLSQRDYYQLQAVIYPAFRVDQWTKPKERVLVTTSAAQIAAHHEELKSLDEKIATARREFAESIRQLREHGRAVFSDSFDGSDHLLTENWSNAAPGDEAPAGQPAVHVDSPFAPSAQAKGGVLLIVESRDEGDRALSTRQSFDWTPDAEGAWIQATFDLVASAPYVAYYLALRDFNDTRGLAGGNVLIDGAAAGHATVDVDYPGNDSRRPGTIGESGYEAGRNYGVRVTNIGGGQFEVTHVVDGLPEAASVKLSAEDLPNGGFGFEYCCGRNFAVDNVLIETGEATASATQRRAELDKRRTEHAAAIKRLERERPAAPGQLAAVTDLTPQPPEVFLLERGAYNAPKDPVGAAAPAVLTEPTNPAEFSTQSGELPNSSGRRLALARWITQPDSRAAALLARVTVNRWWQHHFGTGLVATSDNLGYSGAPPTHPELLEMLAAELVRGGWSAKSIHRLILNSAAYRQSSVPHAEGTRIDPSNRLLWHYPLRRLDAEAIRDAMLAVSGELDLRSGGPYVPTQRNDEGDVVVDEVADGARRRSIYLQQRRTQVPGMLEAFDAPSIVANCTLRTSTTVPLQSLRLLNSNFIRLRAAAFAKRLELSATGDQATRLQRAFLLAWGRAPSANELAGAQRFLATQPAEYVGEPDAEERAWIDLAQTLLAGSSALYVE